MTDDNMLDLTVTDQFQLRHEYVLVVLPKQTDLFLGDWEGQRLVYIESGGTTRHVVGRFFFERVSTTSGQRETIFAIALPNSFKAENIERVKFPKNGAAQYG